MLQGIFKHEGKAFVLLSLKLTTYFIHCVNQIIIHPPACNETMHNARFSLLRGSVSPQIHQSLFRSSILTFFEVSGNGIGFPMHIFIANLVSLPIKKFSKSK